MRGTSSHKSELHILPYIVRIGSVKKVDLPSISHYLAQPFVQNYYQNAFFSYTRTSTEVSFVFEQSLDNAPIRIWPNNWRVLNVAAGQLGGEACELVKNLTQPLASAKITVFYLSTYQTDFILVPEENLQDVRMILAHYFHLVDTPLPSPSVSVVPSRTSSPSPSPTLITISLPEVVEIQPEETKQADKRPLRLMPNCLHVTSVRTTLSHEQISGSVLWPLLDLMFYTDSQFFSITIVEGDVSVVLDENSLTKLPSHALNMTNTSWRLFDVDTADGLGYEEVGILVRYARPLVESAHLSIYYISTFETDHILVQEHDLDIAVDAFEEADIHILKLSPQDPQDKS